MTPQDHLLTIAMEECAELAQRISKALRFDLRAVLGMCGIDAWDMSETARRLEAAKVRKVHHYFERSAREGRLDE